MPLPRPQYVSSPEPRTIFSAAERAHADMVMQERATERAARSSGNTFNAITDSLAERGAELRAWAQITETVGQASSLAIGGGPAALSRTATKLLIKGATHTATAARTAYGATKLGTIRATNEVLTRPVQVLETVNFAIGYTVDDGLPPMTPGQAAGWATRNIVDEVKKHF